MAATLEQVMDAVEAALNALPNLRVIDYVPDSVPVSGSASAAIIPVPAVPSYRETFGRGKYILTVDVIVLVSPLLDRTGQRKLAAYANQTGDSSLRAAIEADRTLGGVVDHAHLESFEPLGMEEVGLIRYYGGRFTIKIAATGV
jgi:hypothetical protein